MIKRVSLSAALLLVVQILAQQSMQAAPVKPFSSADYPKNTATVSQFQIKHGDLIVEVAQVKRLDEKHSNPRYCRAWITVYKKGKKLSSEYFADINGLGGQYGMFSPNGTLPNGLHSLVKLGDYDGRLLLINNDGKYWNLPGGSFFLSKDIQQLFSIHESEAKTGLAVFDLKSGSLRFQTDEKAKSAPPVIDKWFFDGKQYFFSTKAADGSSSKADKREVYAYDNNTRKLVRKMVSSKQLNSAEKVKYDFDAMSKKDLELAQLDAPEGKAINASKEASDAK